MKRLTSILLLLLLAGVAHADRVRVRLFSSNTVKTLNISFDLGNYNLYADVTLHVRDMKSGWYMSYNRWHHRRQYLHLRNA